MPLIYNGTEIEKVVYNGIELDSLVYNGATVYEKQKKIVISANKIVIYYGVYDIGTNLQLRVYCPNATDSSNYGTAKIYYRDSTTPLFTRQVTNSTSGIGFTANKYNYRVEIEASSSAYPLALIPDTGDIITTENSSHLQIQRLYLPANNFEGTQLRQNFTMYYDPKIYLPPQITDVINTTGIKRKIYLYTQNAISDEEKAKFSTQSQYTEYEDNYILSNNITYETNS